MRVLPTVPVDLYVEGYPERVIGSFIMVPADRAVRLGLREGDRWRSRHVLTYDASDLMALKQEEPTE